MVRVGDMLSKKKSVLHKDSSDMAQKMFRAHASRIPGAPPPEKPLLDGWDEGTRCEVGRDFLVAWHV